MNDFPLQLTDDGALLLAGTRLDTDSTVELIELLGLLRAQMQPPVPRRWAARQNLDPIHEPAIKVGPGPNGDVVLALRHPGFGWCAFQLTRLHAAALRESLARHTAGISSPLDLLDLGPEPGEAH